MCVSSCPRAVTMSRHGMGMPYGQDKHFVEHHMFPPMRLRPDLHSMAKPPCRSIMAFISHSWRCRSLP